jgi:uncharacterized protein with PIN domain
LQRALNQEWPGAAAAARDSLLFVGDDFRQTDITPA